MIIIDTAIGTKGYTLAVYYCSDQFHRLFPHLTRACSGVIFDSWKTVKSLMEKAKTSKGLRVFATLLEGVYATGKKVATEFKENLPIIFDEYLPQWNYTVQPQSV